MASTMARMVVAVTRWRIPLVPRETDELPSPTNTRSLRIFYFRRGGSVSGSNRRVEDGVKFVNRWVVIDQARGISFPGTDPPADAVIVTCQLNLTVSSKCYVIVPAVVDAGELREVLLEIC